MGKKNLFKNLLSLLKSPSDFALLAETIDFEELLMSNIEKNDIVQIKQLLQFSNSKKDFQSIIEDLKLEITKNIVQKNLYELLYIQDLELTSEKFNKFLLILIRTNEDNKQDLYTQEFKAFLKHYLDKNYKVEEKILNLIITKKNQNLLDIIIDCQPGMQFDKDVVKKLIANSLIFPVQKNINDYIAWDMILHAVKLQGSSAESENLIIAGLKQLSYEYPLYKKTYSELVLNYSGDSEAKLLALMHSDLFEVFKQSNWFDSNLIRIDSGQTISNSSGSLFLKIKNNEELLKKFKTVLTYYLKNFLKIEPSVWNYKVKHMLTPVMDTIFPENEGQKDYYEFIVDVLFQAHHPMQKIEQEKMALIIKDLIRIRNANDSIKFAESIFQKKCMELEINFENKEAKKSKPVLKL